MTDRDPPTFTIDFGSADDGSCLLTTSQVLSPPRRQVFAFFEDPRNLYDITPDWLRFVMKDRSSTVAVFDGAEFDYTIRWFGLTLPWRSRIGDYRPPERFMDIQLIGPYRAWQHLHTFDDTPEGTVMRDRVVYRLPLGGLGRLVHAAIIRRQLQEIFRYRARAIDAWARGSFTRKT